jgi:hypothetical protein
MSIIRWIQYVKMHGISICDVPIRMVMMKMKVEDAPRT